MIGQNANENGLLHASRVDLKKPAQMLREQVLTDDHGLLVDQIYRINTAVIEIQNLIALERHHRGVSRADEQAFHAIPLHIDFYLFRFRIKLFNNATVDCRPP